MVLSQILDSFTGATSNTTVYYVVKTYQFYYMSWKH